MTKARVLRGVVARFQPIVSTSTREIVLFEALARRAKNTVQRAPVVDIAEEYGLSDVLDCTMLKLVLDELERRSELVLTVNVSVLSIESSTPVLLEVIRSREALAKRLVVEIVETVRLSDPEPVCRFVDAVRELGCSIALDDYGSGQFVVDHGLIERLQPDWLKLSDTAVEAFMVTRDASIFRRLLKRIAPFGGHLIAEHIDSEERLQRVKRAGVTHAQGYLFGKAALLPERVVG